MRNHTVRLYALATALTVFFLSWAVLAARPWKAEAAAPTAEDPRLAQLAQRERQLRREAARAQAIVDKRWAAYRTALARRKRQNASIRDTNAQLAAAAPPRIVTVPSSSAPSPAPVTSTRTS